MSNNRIHIVCLDVPFPPDYGGVFDLFYKIKYLSRQGVGIILHCFEYGRGRQSELEKYCENVYYYPRKKSVSFRIPYIVSSRRNTTLLDRLLADDYPVLLEGIHCTYYLFNGALSQKKCFVRLHNIEYRYYNNLAKSEKKILRKIYFKFESLLLRKYEKAIASKGKFLCVSEHDRKEYQVMGAKEAIFFPLFIDKMQVSSKLGKGSFCLYHGNLSVSENEEAVLFLIKEVFSKLPFPCVVAGRNPTPVIRKVCQRQNIRLVSNPAEEELSQLLEDAQVHVLPSMNTTGIKIKLINALFHGRFVVTNFQGVEGSHLENLCRICNTVEEFRKVISILMDTEFNNSEREHREEILLPEFNSEENAKLLIKLIFS